MAQVIFTVESKGVIKQDAKVQEEVNINVSIDGVDYDDPSSADILAGIIKKMAPIIIKAANIHYMENVDGLKSYVKFTH
ncbi:hypothetical protein ACW6AV_002330 [Edwardsiella piscicida]|uniref:hypothetical protein n=1 Tax=Edwardsiella piscicida TaxID=1263550 RepID=UPI000D51CDE1|nr:hypothetical protein [Edwardsiella piscicida]ELM3734824.1 hypothetical protein [Edwardsiella piscicida]QBB14215.1 hypothetical protein EVK84_17530 [Edwardsiella piscicida]UCQ39651.1 hypothetical protein DCF38_08865 [Edwardsiella piscicida]WGS78542.1 hypothetical protein PED68_07835 [Edwardsiella piscicida]WGS81927.1 hypothetical protein PED70_07840 [Edwardsiella piscicida]